MFDTPASPGRASPAHGALLQRVAGEAVVTLGPDGGVRQLRQVGSAKAFLPRVHGPVPEIVFLNTAGGLTGGDALRICVGLAPGIIALATTQTAERAYDAGSGPPARVEVMAEVGAGARLDWLPQDTILFDNAALTRETEIRLTGSAACLTVETVVLGRAAMGETVRRLRLRDRRRVLRDGRPVLVEPLQLDTGALASDGPARLDGARAVASLAFVAPGAEDALSALRGVTLPDGVHAAASAWDGRLTWRALAADAFPLRRAVAAAVRQLTGGALPRVWQI